MGVERDDDLELPPADGDGDDASDGNEGDDVDLEEATDTSRDDAISDEGAFFDLGEIDLRETSATDDDDLPLGDVVLGGIDIGEDTDLLSDLEEAGVEQDALGDVAELAFAFDAGEEGPDTEEEQLREEDLPALDADADGDFDDGRTGLIDLVPDGAVTAPEVDAEGFFTMGRTQLAWVRGAFSRFGVAVDPGDVMGADVDGSRVALWTIAGELWQCDARKGKPTRIAESGAAGAAFIGDDLVVFRRQRGTLWVLAERDGDDGRVLMTFEALVETAIGATDDEGGVTARIIDVLADRAGEILHVSTDRGVWSFRCEVGAL